MGSTLLEEVATRFLVGGAIVSAFAVLGNLFKPKSFAGLFGAAPSVALATLLLTTSKHGQVYASIEARSMMVGAVALFCYSIVVGLLLGRNRLAALRATLSSLPVWFGAAFGLWSVFFR
jgi:hypothetical protein